MANQVVSNNEEQYIITTSRGLRFPRPAPKSINYFKHPELLLPRRHVRFAEMYPEVKSWLEVQESEGTRIAYGLGLVEFCIDMDITPSEFGELWKTQETMLKARDLVSRHVLNLTAARPKQLAINSLKSFFRWYSHGFILPLDTKKGGSCYISVKKRRENAKQKYPWGQANDVRRKVSEIIGAAQSLHDKAMFSFLYHTGCRKNVIGNLKIKDVQDYIEVNGKKLLVLTITGEIDSKISHYDFPLLEDSQKYGYYTYLANDALDTFERYLEKYHPTPNQEEYVFFPGYKRKRISTKDIAAWRFKKAVENAGYPQEQIWIHQLRACFEQLAKDANLQTEEKEFLAGHLLPGAQKHYNWQNKMDSARFYLKIDFGIPRPDKDEEIEKLRRQVEAMSSRQVEPAKPKVEALPELKQPGKEATREEINKAFNEFNKSPSVEKQPTPPPPTPKPEPQKPIEQPKPTTKLIEMRACPIQTKYVPLSYCNTECRNKQGSKDYVECYKARARIKAGLLWDQDKVLYEFARIPDTNRYQIEKNEIVS